MSNPAELVFLDAEDNSSKDLVRRLSLLVETFHAAGRPVLLRVSSEKAARFWDQQLWTFKDQAFIPHGLAGAPGEAPQEGEDWAWPQEEPICITWNPVAPREGALILALSDTPIAELRRFATVYELVRRDTPETLEQSRRRWAEWKALGLAPTVLKDW